MKRPPGLDMLARARGLRREMTPQEKILWGRLRGHRLERVKFRRQMWLSGYIADFACPEAMLVVEADGSQHDEDVGYDATRFATFERLGWRTLRFWNNQINEDLDGVLIAIREALLSPLPQGECRVETAPGSLQIVRGTIGPALEGPAAQRGEGEGTCIPSPVSPSASHPLPKWERD